MNLNYKSLVYFILLTHAIFLYPACQETSITQSSTSQYADPITDGDNIFIVDRTGKRWDITHASNRYGFKADQFQHGLGLDAIQSIDYPQMFSPGEPGYPLTDDEIMMIGTRFDEDARAYPIFVMKSHEIVNELISENYVAVAYWPLVKLAAVYSREIDSKKLTLGASGWTYKNTFVLYDRQTESLWYHLEGTDGLTCISGQYQDRTLAEFPSVFGRWNAWVVNNPDSKYLKYNPNREE